MAAVEIVGVEKLYGKVVALRRIDLSIPDAELIVLVGPSGCGKSTLLRMIAGLESIDTGEISIGGRVVNDLEPKERDVAMVFQNYALYPHKNVYDNMAFSLKMKHVRKAEIADRVQAVAEILGLGDLLERFPRQLSGGQRQRVAMGRAIIRKPQVFLFDEPLSNLDAKLRVQMRAEIKTLHRRLATTSIFVTHDQVEAMTLADRIVVMNEGLVEQEGAPLEIYDKPVNRFVASFIGSPAMNFLEGVIRVDNGVVVVETADGMKLATPENAEVEDGMPVVYGIRPEHLSLTTNQEGLAVRVNVVEPTGSATFAYCHLGDLEICAQFAERPNFSPGADIHLSVDLDKVHLFSAESGDRVRCGAANLQVG